MRKSMIMLLACACGMSFFPAVSGEFGEGRPAADVVQQASDAESELAAFREEIVTCAKENAREARDKAVEYAEENGLEDEEKTVLIAAVVNAATEPAMAIIKVRKTSAASAVYDAQKDAPRFSKEKSAVALLNDYAVAKRFITSWDAENQRMFVVQSASFNTQNPAADPVFAESREVAMRQASLMAKSDILKFISMNMSAREQFDIPGTDIHEQLNGEFEKAKIRLGEQQKALAKLLEAVDKARADELAGVGFGDRAMELFDAAIKKINAEYTKEKVAADKIARVQDIEKRYRDAAEMLRQIESEAEKLRHKPLDSTRSEVEIMSSMPLLGAVVVQTAESWNPDKKQYEVAVLTCWSPDFEKAARAALAGEVPCSDNIGRESLMEWLSTQDIGGLIGARQFLDPQGNRHFLGIAARPVLANSALDRRNRMAADAFASQQANFCLFADVSTYLTARQQADSIMTEDGLSALKIASSLESRIQQSFSNMQIHGNAPIHRTTAIHPITGQELYVSVYGISPASAAQAMMAQQKAMLASIRLYDVQNYLRGRHEALTSRVEEAQKSADSFKRGVDAGQSLNMDDFSKTSGAPAASKPASEEIRSGDSSRGAVQSAPDRVGGDAKTGARIPGDVDVN